MNVPIRVKKLLNSELFKNIVNRRSKCLCNCCLFDLDLNQLN